MELPNKNNYEQSELPKSSFVRKLAEEIHDYYAGSLEDGEKLHITGDVDWNDLDETMLSDVETLLLRLLVDRFLP